MSTVAYVLGCRPNFVKLAPVYHALRERAPGARHLLVHTGQHYDAAMSDVFLEELGLPEPDHFLSVGSGGHGEQTGRALERIEHVLVEEQPDVVVVGGDVNSTLAGALAAAKLQIPVAHVEAGLRSFDWAMPEEINRVLTDRLSQWCFTHSPEAEENLSREGIDRNRVFFVGNTMIDSLVRLRPRIDASPAVRELGLERAAYVLVTLHRPALTDGPMLDPVARALASLAKQMPVVFPVHPRTRAALGDAGIPGVQMLEPLGYIDFLALQAQAAAVVTDSGGIQEETTFLRVPCFTVRDTTERPVTIERGTNRLIGVDPAAVAQVADELAGVTLPLAPPELWDGRAGERVADVLVEVLADDVRDLRNRRAR